MWHTYSIGYILYIYCVVCIFDDNYFRLVDANHCNHHNKTSRIDVVSEKNNKYIYIQINIE